MKNNKITQINFVVKVPIPKAAKLLASLGWILDPKRKSLRVEHPHYRIKTYMGRALQIEVIRNPKLMKKIYDAPRLREKKEE